LRHLWRLPLLALPLLLLACAPKLQPLGPPIADPPSAATAHDERRRRLPLRHWPAEGKTKAVVPALHGFNDYSKSFGSRPRTGPRRGSRLMPMTRRLADAITGLWPGTSA
jgi:hypothetical protein